LCECRKKERKKIFIVIPPLRLAGLGRLEMSEAGSSDGYDEMSCSQEDTSDPEEEIFDSEPIRQQTQTFTVLDASECLALAQKEVDEVRELLCCSEEVASILMRQFRWNREKLTEGEDAPAAEACLLALRSQRPATRAQSTFATQTRYSSARASTRARTSRSSTPTALWPSAARLSRAGRCRTCSA